MQFHNFLSFGNQSTLLLQVFKLKPKNNHEFYLPCRGMI
ncbi:hypothetical protein M23134_04367 [Microscilla marina ATCC 23134]|uniref:Uncharacterized protein n=1 Tax=Microscilla marina ATCC 23134 TaxID=313606 RepID=A1ZLY9_MICM2|nr:hypothetical protein M23134_04367 [Microscilla marina ATCC 23134]